jgi:hypothetical protein
MGLSIFAAVRFIPEQNSKEDREVLYADVGFGGAPGMFLVIPPSFSKKLATGQHGIKMHQLESRIALKNDMHVNRRNYKKKL